MNEKQYSRDNDAQLPSLHNSSVPKSSPIEVLKRRHASCDSVSSSHGYKFDRKIIILYFIFRLFRTPDKVYYSKLRAAFATPGTIAHSSSHMGSYSRTMDNDLPYGLMMQQHQSMEQEQNSKNNFYINTDLDNETAPDDFILVEVKPFFGKSDSTDDLALFIRTCQQPPMLESFIIEPSLGETINQLNDELRVFESKVEEFDQLVTTLSSTES